MPFQVSPGVNVSEIDLTTVIPAVSTSVGGFGTGTTQTGITMSKKVKQVGCSMLKNMVEEEKLIINDFDTISELSSFVSKAQSYEADAGCHDDLVMSLLLFAWLSSQPHFKEITDLDLRRRMLQESSLHRWGCR